MFEFGFANWTMRPNNMIQQQSIYGIIKKMRNQNSNPLDLINKWVAVVLNTESHAPDLHGPLELNYAPRISWTKLKTQIIKKRKKIFKNNFVTKLNY